MTSDADILWRLTGVVAVSTQLCRPSSADAPARPMLVAQQGGRGVAWCSATQQSYRIISKTITSTRRTGRVVHYEVTP